MKEIAEVAYSSAAAEAGSAGAGATPGGGSEEPGKGDEDVIDAEFEEGD
jgi:hypothetical protein